MSTDKPAPDAAAAAAVERERIERARRILTRLICAVAVVFAATLAALAGTLVASQRSAQREAGIFASISAAAYRQGLCDRALRLAVAGLPPGAGGWLLSFQSRELQDDLSFIASAHDCYFRLGLAGHTALVSGAAFSPDGSRVVTASWDSTARVWNASTGAALILSGHGS